MQQRWPGGFKYTRLVERGCTSLSTSIPCPSLDTDSQLSTNTFTSSSLKQTTTFLAFRPFQTTINRVSMEEDMSSTQPQSNRSPRANTPTAPNQAMPTMISQDFFSPHGLAGQHPTLTAFSGFPEYDSSFDDSFLFGKSIFNSCCRLLFV